MLDTLFRAVAPFIKAAGSPAVSGIRLFPGSGPLVVEVLADTRAFRAVGYGDVGEALTRLLGDFLEKGLNLLPATQRRALADLLESERGVLVVHLEPVFHTATVHLVIDAETDMPLVTLSARDVH
jgi:hypothetical protein